MRCAIPRLARPGIIFDASCGVERGHDFSWIDDRIGSKRAILVSLAGLIATSAAILLAPTQALFWAAGLLLGVFVGPVQAASRSYMSRAAPPELRTQMFGLFALSGKATAFVGPLLVGAITAAAGSQRLGMAIVIVFFAAGAAVIVTVPEPER